MTDRNALLRAVLETPDDDTPRLVFADWLDDTGIARDAARAALIRLQCERARLTGEQRTPAVVSGYLRQEEPILRKWAAGWLPKTLRPAVPATMEVRGEIVTVPQLDGYVIFERGFVGRLGFDLVNFTACTHDVLGQLPEYGAAIEIAAAQARAVFAAAPLTGISVSFAGNHAVPTMHIEVSPGVIRLDDESNQWIGDHSALQVRGVQCPTRSGLGQAIPAAMREILTPLAQVAVETTAEPVGYYDPGECPDF